MKKQRFSLVFLYKHIASISVIVLLSTSFFMLSVRAQDAWNVTSYQERALQDIYKNPNFLPLIDVDKAEIQLTELSRAFQKISGEFASLWERKEILDDQYTDAQKEITQIINDSNAAQGRLSDALTKMTLYTKKIERLQEGIDQMKKELLQERENMAIYVQFLYKMNNAYASPEAWVEDLKLFVKSESIAHTLSRQELTELLTLKLQTLMDAIRDKQNSYGDMIVALTTTKNKYKMAVQFYKRNLQDLKEQQKSLYELLSYIQQDRAAAAAQIDQITSSKDQLADQVEKLKRVSEQKKGVLVDQESNVYKLLNAKDREDSQTYFSWPAFPFEKVLYTFHDEKYTSVNGDYFEGVRLIVEQGSEVYAPAPGIVYKVFTGKGLQKSRVILIHKYGYSTVLTPLSEILVQEGQIVERGEVIGRSGGKPWTSGAGMWSPGAHLDFKVLQNAEAIDPFLSLDISIFKEKRTLPEKYHTKYLQDYFLREVDLVSLPSAEGESDAERAQSFLDKYASAPYNNLDLRIDAADSEHINPYFGMCIWFAETSFKNFKSANNIWNVWNNDRGDTQTFDSPVAGARALFSVLNNQYLGQYKTIDQLSRFGNQDGKIYASSPYNRQKNIMKCLTTVYDYNVPEDFAFRIHVWQE